MTQAVAYLARGKGGGLAAASAFLASYAAHRAGIAHDLVVLAKGWDGDGAEGPEGRSGLDAAVGAHGGRVIDVADDGFDWGAYLRVAPSLDHHWICFLNTHSRILSDGWLAKLRAGAELAGVGMAGASGSFATILPTFGFTASAVADIARERGVALATAYATYKTAAGCYTLGRYGRRFPRFPNAHLRSNAFLLRRQLFVEFAAVSRVPRSKNDAHFLESGESSLTAFVKSRAMRVVVVGADGVSYEEERWIESRTFWMPRQENLLVGDNQSRKYDAVPPSGQRNRERNAWGKVWTSITRQATQR